MERVSLSCAIRFSSAERSCGSRRAAACKKPRLVACLRWSRPSYLSLKLLQAIAPRGYIHGYPAASKEDASTSVITQQEARTKPELV